jgi:hypothetical protein
MKLRTLAFSLALGVPFTASAQTVLPDLAPRQVEIRGELTIAFPSLRRQPLIGFNPPPRVPEIDIRRMPYVEAYKQQGAVLPQNPLGLPIAPNALPRAAGNGFTGTAEFGIGRYAARYALLEAALRTTSNSRWTVNGSYSGTSSFAPFGVDAPADGIRGGTRYSTRGRRVAFGVEAEGSADSYRLYGISSPATTGARSAPNRVRNDVSAKLWLGSGTSSRIRVRSSISVFAGDVSTNVFDQRTDPRTRQNDVGGEFDFKLEGKRLEIDGKASRLDLDSQDSGRALGWFETGGAIRMNLWGASARLGGRVMGFDATPEATRGTRRALTYFSPSFRLEFSPAPNVRVDLSQSPSVGTARPSALFRSLPFLVDEPHLEPVLNVVDATARVRGFWRTFQASGYASVKQSPNWRVFEHDATTYAGYDRGFSTVFHTAARTITGGAELRFSPLPGFEARVGGRVQDGRMTDLDASIPYFPTWGLDGLLSAAFAKGQGVVQLTGRVLGPRSRDRSGSAEVPTYADLDLRVSYSITRQALLAVEVRNMLGDAPYWDHYPEAPGTVLVGLGWRW